MTNRSNTGGSNSGSSRSGDLIDPATGQAQGARCVEVCADTRKFDQQISESESIAKRFTGQLFNSLEQLAIKGKSITDVLKSLALSLSQSILKSALKPLENAVSGSLGSLFKGLLPFAKGGVLRHGTPVPFASGGVISSPITFPLSGGRTGLAGERGPEAIMPLARGADGRLGVVARGGGGTNVTINIAAQDVESFRRSETQVAALLSRAITLGQRNL